MKKSKWSAKYLRVVSLFLLIGTRRNRLWAAPGDLDLSFDTGSGINGAVRGVVVESDGKFAVTAPTPVLQADVRRELAEVDPDDRFVRWLANKQTVED